MNKLCFNCNESFVVLRKNQALCKECKKIPNIFQDMWGKRNPQRRKEIMRKYRESHLELCRKRVRINQLKLNNTKRFGGLRYEVLERDNYSCQICKKDISGKNMACIHHINKNKSDNRMENLISYCKACHPEYHYWQGDYPISGAPVRPQI